MTIAARRQGPYASRAQRPLARASEKRVEKKNSAGPHREAWLNKAKLREPFGRHETGLGPKRGKRNAVCERTSMRLWSFALATGLLRVTAAVAQALNTGPAVATLPPALKSCAEQMISVFENESTSLRYDYVENLHDGRGYTAGRDGFASGDGDLLQVVEVYDDLRPDNILRSFVPLLKQVQGTASTHGLGALPAAWRKAASDPLFRRAQDQVSDKLYYMPAMKAASELHLQSPLSKFAFNHSARDRRGFG